ncbi:MAG: heme-binding protein [Candidatus Omnitrophota bacterium]|jgi:effector-binding domain-containing protein
MAKIETPPYQVIQSAEKIEVREYAPMIVAEVEVAGERGKAINAGFRILADYIFGNNAPGQSIAMTAPVIQQKGEKIAMTTPVSQTRDGDLWKVRFTMPSSYTLETLPKPNNPAIKILSVPGQRTVAIRFSGFWTDRNLRKHSEKLDAFIQDRGLKTVGDPIYAFYNPPWTLPFFRRNEVIYSLQEK